jgi:non-specific serine/threonine protein kinase/serine/threonine-protein kinase
VPTASIGPYRLLEKIGEGGMGVVWLAEQIAPVKRHVALKLIRSGAYDDSVARRFESERQTLAIMEHPTIAKVFDAGSTPSGQPYLVMEYVPGMPITGYCDSHKLVIPERLALFTQVCEGVQHAHQKAIIHRDLKPSNILVVELDGQPAPRIIDFGIAKATLQIVGELAQLTREGSPVGTPGYMSPEQADPGLGDVDTRTDVYSLGVILYELLAGTHPFEARRWHKQPYDELLRQIREEDPPNPSTSLITEEETSDVTAEMRGTETNQLVTLLRGDLDWITMKAMEKDRARRYGTPAELSADIARYLRNEPVVARPATTGYRLRKYVRRHRFGVTGAAILATLLVAFAVMQTVQLRRITRERDRADRITQFMTHMFQISDPSEARGNSVTAREILDKAAKDIDTGLEHDPVMQAQMMDVMGTVYDNLGLYPRAEALAQRSLNIYRGTLGEKNYQTMRAANNLGNILYDEGRYPESENLYRKTLEIRKVLLGPEHLETLMSMNNLANSLFEEGHYTESEKLYRDALDIARRVLGAEHRQTVIQMGNLVNVLAAQGHNEEAESLCREVLEVRRRTLGPEHQDTLRSMNDLSETMMLEGKYADAENLNRQTFDLRRRVLGAQHPETLLSTYNLAGSIHEQGRLAEAEKLYREVSALQQKILGPDNVDTLRATSDLGATLSEEGQFVEGERLLRKVLEAERRVLGPEHPETLRSLASLAGALKQAGRYAESEKLGRETLETLKRVLGPNHPQTLGSAYDLAGTLQAEGGYAEAEKLCGEVLEKRGRVLGPEHPDTAASTYCLARNAALQRQYDHAITLLREAVSHGLSQAATRGIETDVSLRDLHNDRRFQELVSEIRQHNVGP